MIRRTCSSSIYGYFQRIRSSRQLEAECQRNIEVMWLLALGNVKRCRDTKPSRKWLEMVSTKTRWTPCRSLERARRWVRRTVTDVHAINATP